LARRINQVFNPSGTLWGGAAIGADNNVQDAFGASLAVGLFNTIYGNYSAAVGYENSVGKESSVAIGKWNFFTEAEAGFVSGSSVVAIGAFNSIGQNSSNGILVGSDNGVGTLDANVVLDSTATFGRGLTNSDWNNATIVGQFNSGSLKPDPVLFAVGNGADATHRNNALEVYTDGTVIVRKRQGDILMGEFGN
jgi:hypothetical protein